MEKNVGVEDMDLEETAEKPELCGGLRYHRPKPEHF